MKEIIVKIDKRTALVTVETQGFEGKACMDATAQLEAALGTTTSDSKTPEWNVEHVRQVGN